MKSTWPLFVIPDSAVCPGFRRNPARQTALSGIHLSACADGGMDSGSQGSRAGTHRVPGSPNARNDGFGLYANPLDIAGYARAPPRKASLTDLSLRPASGVPPPHLSTEERRVRKGG